MVVNQQVEKLVQHASDDQKRFLATSPHITFYIQDAPQLSGLRALSDLRSLF